MAGEDDLWKAMKSALSSSGDLIHLRMRLEENILKALQQPKGPNFMNNTMFSNPIMIVKPVMPLEILLVNSLIMQYLRRNGLMSTAEVLSFECSLSEKHASNVLLLSKCPSSCYSTKPFLNTLTDEYILRKHEERED